MERSSRLGIFIFCKLAYQLDTFVITLFSPSFVEIFFTYLLKSCCFYYIFVALKINFN